MAPMKKKPPTETSEGCVCTIGCSLGVPVQDGDEFIQMECSAPVCVHDLRVHSVCFDKWQHELIKVVEKAPRKKGWRPGWVLNHLWTPTCLHHSGPQEMTKCRCGAQLIKALDTPKTTEGTAAPASKPAKHTRVDGMGRKANADKALMKVSQAITKAKELKAPEGKASLFRAETETAYQSGYSSSYRKLSTAHNDQQTHERKYPVGFAPVQPQKKEKEKREDRKTWETGTLCASSTADDGRTDDSDGKAQSSRASSIGFMSESEVTEQIEALKLLEKKHREQSGSWKTAAGGEQTAFTSLGGDDEMFVQRRPPMKITGGKFDLFCDIDEEQIAALDLQSEVPKCTKTQVEQRPFVSSTEDTRSVFAKSSTEKDGADTQSALSSTSGLINSRAYRQIESRTPYDISGHCFITDVQPLSYARESALLANYVHRLRMPNTSIIAPHSQSHLK